MLALAGAVIAIYAASLGGGFVWDDHVIVEQKAAEFAEPGSVARAFTTCDTGAGTGGTPYYRPLTLLSFLVNSRLTGPSPFWFRLVSLGLHALNVLLLFLLVRRAFGDEALAFAAALLFAVHPAQVEAVAFIVARNNLLCALGLLGALLALSARSRLGVALSFPLFACALLAKEPAVVLPVFLAGLRLASREARLRTPWSILAGQLALLAGYFAARVAVLGVALSDRAALPPGEHARLVVAAVYESLRILAWPVPLNAMVRPELLGVSAFKLVAVVGALAALAWAIAARRSPEPLRAGCLWLLLGLLPISNLVPIASAPVAERYLYVPGLGFALAVAALWAGARKWAPRAAAGALAALALALGSWSAARTTVWHDDLALYRSMVASHPGNAVAFHNLGKLRFDAGRLDEAILAWVRASQLDPEGFSAYNNLGNAYALRGDDRRAWEAYEAALRHDPEEAMPLFNLARIHERQGRAAEAERCYREYVRRERPAGDPERQERVRRAREWLERL